MKLRPAFLLILSGCSLTALLCCTRQEGVQPKSAANSVVIQCYRGIHQQDTAALELHLSGTQVSGNLSINYAGRGRDAGNLKGQLKGDTLYADYGYQSNGINIWYRDPVALLRRGNQLLMGDGMMVTSWGRKYFNKAYPIDYARPLFILEPCACHSK